jgi:putative peptidoglycan lipid II flippase
MVAPFPPHTGGTLPAVSQEQRLLRHASRMAVVTLFCRVSGYLRDKALFSVVGAGFLYDAYRTANRIPNAFRGLFAEGTLHAAFVPTLSGLIADGDRKREAEELFRGLLAVLLLVVGLVVAVGIVASPWLVRIFAQGFVDVPGKLGTTVLMNRIMFPYLALISLAALLQAVLNSHERFLLPAATPMFFNLVVAGAAWWLVPRAGDPRVVLASAVVLGGCLQAGLQAPAVRSLGFRLRPLWRAARSPRVRQILVLMLPGIPVLGINQINQLSYTYGAYRVTELVFGAVVVQMTTVLLPLLSKELRTDPEQASRTLLNTISLVSFVTMPTAVVMAVLGRPIIGLLFGGGEFGPGDVSITGATLTAYAFSLVGTGHVKVMASAFFAQRDTRVPMWGSGVALVVFTMSCWALVGPLGTPGLGWANTVAMGCFGTFLTVLYAVRYGFDRDAVRRTVAAIARQVAAAAAVAVLLLRLRSWVEAVDHTSLTGVLQVSTVLAPAAIVYLVTVILLGGREPSVLAATFKRGTDE